MNEHVVAKSIKLSNDILLDSVVAMVKSGKFVKINVAGSSMKPFLHNGDTIILKDIKLNKIRNGDIILGKYNNAYILHRVIRQRKDCIYMAGDNNLSLVEIIPNSAIYARAVTLVKPKHEGDLTSFYSRWLGLCWYYLRPFRRLYIKIYK